MKKAGMMTQETLARWLHDRTLGVYPDGSLVSQPGWDEQTHPAVKSGYLALARQLLKLLENR